MDLFVINRYWGETKSGEKNGTVEPQQKIQKILQRIAERKSLKEQQRIDPQNEDREGDNENSALLESPKKKRRKKKRVETKSESDFCGEKDIKIEHDLKEDEDSGRQFSHSSEKSEISEGCHAGINVIGTSDPDGDVSVDFAKTEGVTKNLDNDTEAPTTATSKIENFTVIGSDSFKERCKARHKLPPWLQNPVKFPLDLENFKDPISKYEDILDAKLIKTLRKNGISHFFPVQSKVIPWLLESNRRCCYHWPRDLCVSAPTGSGKTLAFVLPIVQALMNRLVPEIRVLVVLPVVELAKQVGNVFHQYCAGTGLQVTTAIGGGKSFSEEHSLLVHHGELIGCQTDIFVTTPGRLVAHLRADSKASSGIRDESPYPEKISLKHLQYLVIDEADRVAEGTQNDWLTHLMDHLERSGRIITGVLPPSVSTFRNALVQPLRPPQKLLFSATLSHDPEKLSTLSLFQPKLFVSTSNQEEEGGENSVNKNQQRTYTTPKELSEEYVVSNDGESDKPLVLLWLLQQRLESFSDTPRVLIFTGTRKSSNRLALLLSQVTWDINSKDIISGHLSSDLSVHNREKILQDFIKGHINILVCSDALARGVDVPSVDLVVSYDPPRFIRNHIHRIGRTGRAGHPGCAITILTPNQVPPFALMVTGGSDMGDRKKIEISSDDLSALSDKYEEALAAMEKILEDELQNTVIAKKKRKKKLRVKKAKPNEEST
ncbi:ATP-dependent RNA helicase DDX51 [Ischnura elegans]|uniref:ATP-dependent RNA helicase DDX51 n=1 Tax=Ischnura elegans TaxID=197161 RepID=UPI001ED8890E|nr:ATP-dependent RNA helicase DDX51 [Ischnura elegans]